MRILVLFLLALMIPTHAFAHGGWGFAPPKKYLGEPKMPVYIISESIPAIQKRCGNKFFPIKMVFGCARKYHSPNRCVIFIPKKSVPNLAWPEGGVAVVTPKMVLIHEKAHCNGWPPNHPLK